MEKTRTTGQYTCNDYREEMVLLGLQRRLASEDLSLEERKHIEAQIAEVEKQMGLD